MTVDRRAFIQVGLSATGALLFRFRARDGGENGVTTAVAPLEPNAFVRIEPDGRVVFFAPVPDIGQGVRTSLCMIIAEELGVNPREVRIEQADGDDTRYGPRQRAAGSRSVRSYWEPLRTAGAAAREMLIAAAAARLRAPAAEFHTANARVIHDPSGRTLTFASLIVAASVLPVPIAPTFKARKDFTIIGRPMANLDTAAITNGTARFGLDIERPGMLRAVIQRSPVFGGRPVSVDDAAARAVSGVVDVVSFEPQGPVGRPFMQGGVAVLATSTWAAMKARAALKVTWDEGPNAGESTTELRARAEVILQDKAKPVRTVGDAYGGIASAAKRIEADYEVPFLAHAPLEPMNCVAEVNADSCELWCPAQIPSAAKNLASRVTGIPEPRVTVHITRIGGGFGRRLGADYAAEAALLAKRSGKPVQVVWTREDDMRHGFYRPFGRHHLSAGVNASGEVVGWVHRVASTSRTAFRANEDPAGSEVEPYDFPGNVIPNVAIEYASLVSTVQRGPWRAPRDNANAFVIESFVDEVAHLTGRDPLEFRLALSGPGRDLPFGRGDEQTGMSSTRLIRVLRLAADRAGWSRPAPAGRARGVAGFFSYASYVAHVAEVSVDRAAGRIVVHRMTTAIDCGTVINPSGVRAQVEGAIVDALSSLHREITFESGRVQQSNFDNYRMLRIDETPLIDVILVPSDELPTGAGEPPYPAVAPAVLNAVFALTGVRIRRLPLDARALRG